MKSKIFVYVMIALMIVPAIGVISQAEEQSVETNLVVRDPIIINNDFGFNVSNGVSSGNGTESNPYIIENWSINGTGYDNCISIFNTIKYVTIRNCYLYNIETYGITRGMIFIENSTNVNIINNTIDNSDACGIIVLGDYPMPTYLMSVNVNIENNIIQNTYEGIYTEMAGNISIIGNDIQYNDLGINSGSAYIDIRHNNIQNNLLGFFIYGKNHEMYNNNIEDNSIGGLNLTGSFDCLVYNNNFINNGYHASAESTVNNWNYTIQWGGNYWDDYTGVDIDLNGYGDTPYISGIVIDYYPFLDNIAYYDLPFSYHLPILIDGNSEFTEENGVTRGTGTSVDPYIIEDWWINGSATGYGIKILNTDAYIKIQNCKMFGAKLTASSSGVMLDNVSYGAIYSNEIYDNEVGVHIFDCYLIDVAYNEIHDNGHIDTGGGGGIFTGVWVANSGYIYVMFNSIYNEQTVSIHIYASWNCSVSGNTVLNGVETGIMLERTTYSQVYGNYVSGCLNGFYGKGGTIFESMKNNYIYDNTFTNSTEKGIYMYNTENNTFYHNNLFSNDVNVIEYNDIFFNGGVYTNIWYDDDSGEGNYYDDYSDDEPEAFYIIYSDVSKTTETNYDMFPLSAPYVEPSEDEEAESEEPLTFGQIITTMLIGLLPVMIIILVMKYIFGLFTNIGNNKGNKGGK